MTTRDRNEIIEAAARIADRWGGGAESDRDAIAAREIAKQIRALKAPR